MAIGFGIIGCGMIANFHAKAIADIRGAKLVACFDTFPACGRSSLAATTGCQAYHDLDKMLADPSCRCRHDLHAQRRALEPAVAAAKAGKHVIVEKPLEITLDRCDKIIRACEKAGVTAGDDLSLAVPRVVAADQAGHRRRPLRPADARRRLREVVSHAGLLRQRRLARHLGTRRRRSADEPGDPQRRSAHLADGSGRRNHRAHRHAGPRADRSRGRGRGHAASSPTGRSGVIEATTAAYPGYLKRIEIHGSKARRCWKRKTSRCWDFANRRKRTRRCWSGCAARPRPAAAPAIPSAIGHHGHTMQFRDVLNAIKKGTRPLIDGHEGRRSVEIILGVYKAAETGKVLQLPLASDPVLKARKRS